VRQVVVNLDKRLTTHVSSQSSQTAYFALAVFMVVFFLTGCSTTPSAPTGDYSLVAINSAIETAMSMGIKGYSPNHREFYSRPFVVPQPKEAKAEGFHERGVAKIVILGAERPYTIESEVRIERAYTPVGEDPAKVRYELERYDKRLGKKLLDEVFRLLERRERDRNIIDDFRPF
jgi:hypothetical protein